MTPESERVKLWREANKERYNKRMKDYMKKRREKKKGNPPIELVPCCRCGKPSAFQNVEGGWCREHWPESKTMKPPEKVPFTVITIRYKPE